MADPKQSGLYTPQQGAEQEPHPDPNPPQDQGDSNEFLNQLAGRDPDQTAYIDDEEVGSLEGVTMTDVYEGVTGLNQEHQEGGAEQLDLLVEQELREGETDDVMEAVQEGLTYVPPIDPPVTPDADSLESVSVAAGFALSADERYQPESLDINDTDRFFDRGDDFTALVRHTLRSNSSTTHLADRLQIATISGTVVVRGVVDDLDDTDNIVSVISDLPGVEAVRDETEVPGL